MRFHERFWERKEGSYLPLTNYTAVINTTCFGTTAITRWVSKIKRLQESFDFSEGTSAKRIFDVQIEKLRAEISFKF
jgi:hypothetical protein